ncbi:putative ribonuclease H-like domain-containing protein [Tanacetum coccineum]|uniref:Ribonuclease H-like domain-containing protein n=1 Tax=Tanacetum coccineum TaxID=301880 RepID=A0ABQ5I8B3_9ASTR
MKENKSTSQIIKKLMVDLLHLEEIPKEENPLMLVIKPHNKNPYELLLGRKPALSFIRPFGCPVTILNTLDHLGKFDAKADEGFFVGYSTNRNGPNWLFDIDALTISMNYKPVVARNQTNGNAGTKENIDAGQDEKKIDSPDAGFKPSGEEGKIDSEHPENEDKADMNNLATTVPVSPIPTTRVHKDHLLKQIIGDIQLAPQTRRMTKSVTEHEPKKVTQVLIDPNWIEAMQDELLQFKLQKVWTLVELPYGKRAIGTKWVYRNKKDDRVARIEAIRLFLPYASFMNFIVYQMDVKSAFLYGTIKEEVYVYQPPGFEDLEFPNKVYKVEKALYGLHQAPKAWYETLSTYLLENRFRRGTIDKTLFIKKDKVKQKDDGIFISQDKYVADILKKFDFVTVKTTSTPIETNKALLKDKEAKDVDVHLYRSMIRSLMYLTASRPDIMFVVCACVRFQVTPKVSHLHAVKRIFRYLKGHPKLGIWYPRDSLFDLEAFFDSDYAGASLDRKSTTGGCQFLRRRLISWKCKKQTIVANSTIEAEYVAAANYKNPVFHSKTKHIEIRHHFIKDSYEKRLIQVIKIHTDHNVADLLTKAFNVSIFQYLIASIGMLNL